MEAEIVPDNFLHSSFHGVVYAGIVGNESQRISRDGGRQGRGECIFYVCLDLRVPGDLGAKTAYMQCGPVPERVHTSYLLRNPAIRMRSALSFMKPSASDWL